jgi:phosphomevalonate kinase
MDALSRTVEVSTPGKVLICGGYVVLNGGHSLVLSTDSRFKTTLKAAASESKHNGCKIFMTVYSPQFGKTWRYSCSWVPEPQQLPSAFKFEAIPTPDSGANPYVENALFYALAAAASLPQMSKLLPGRFALDITINADNDFYSHSKALKSKGLVPTRQNLSQIQPYAPLGTSITKTGLGSSAALVSSLTACTMAWAFNWANFDDHIDLAHNVAQVAHCQAQGKIGSGFDVASAFFGSQHYIRFPREPLDAIMKAYASYQSDHTQILALLQEIQALVAKKWMIQTPTSIALPRGLTMVLGECGKDMNTPTSVKLVLDWAAKNKMESDILFENLSSNNLFIIETFKKLDQESVAHAQSYDATLQACSKLLWREWAEKVTESKTRGLLLDLQQAFKKQRGLMKALGANAGTPVEPDEITEILNETEETLGGVLATGAPGAGGYDAVFTLLLDPELVPRLEEKWLSHAPLPMSCLLTQESHRGVLLHSPASSSSGTCPFGRMPSLTFLTAMAFVAIGMAGLWAYQKLPKSSPSQRS